ncbi:hypothetical protein [Engelhardtia mirabilis]|uniref:Uncharacterized protein n=1 Tax=Engelhardtia mirabilis TaxID=2528011 RepID=A0A518BGW5_9BACT|nr:hypothetical protein Pla133_12600 [Planctomycetes bacterium Pla133]QDV00521.1 hypothetical protein Pla86_12600 [Planctomycetes bacterium Pla86]
MKIIALLTCLLVLQVPDAIAQASDRSIEAVQFLPGSTPGEVLVEVTVGLDSSDAGQPKDLSFVLDVSVPGIPAWSGLVAASDIENNCSSFQCEALLCKYFTVGSGTGAIVDAPCTPLVVGGSDCGCLGKFSAGLSTSMQPGSSVTVQVIAAPFSEPDTDSSNDVFTLPFDKWFGLEALSTDRITVPLTTGGPQVLYLDAGAAHAGEIYLVIGSASGTSPGVVFGNATIPLNFDAYLQTTLQSINTPVFAGTFGILDGTGQASCSINVPAGLSPSLAGLGLHHAGLTFDFNGALKFASNPVPLTLTGS